MKSQKIVQTNDENLLNEVRAILNEEEIFLTAWQKEEWIDVYPAMKGGESKNYTWEEVNIGHVRSMSCELVFKEEADRDTIEGYRWYEKQRLGLGELFLEEIEKYLTTIKVRRFHALSSTSRLRIR